MFKEQESMKNSKEKNNELQMQWMVFIELANFDTSPKNRERLDNAIDKIQWKIFLWETAFLKFQ